MSPLYALLIVAPALYLVYVLSARSEPKHYRRYDNLDGLRGFAALGVYLSHASLYYFYKETGSWSFAASNFSNSFYNNSGSGAVAMFFMMSSFLFYGKVREQSSVDWIKLYTSRVFRLYPMYFLSSAVGVALVFLTLKNNNNITIDDIINILEFRGVGDIFGVKNVALVTNGTAWTLPYEWCLYLSLPVAWILLHRKINFAITAIASLSVLIMVIYTKYVATSHELFFYFITGIIAYEISKSKIKPACEKFASTKTASVVILVASIAAINLTYNSADANLQPNSSITSLTSIALYSLIFILIALGNNMFGILVSRTAIKLGEISYSFYILQFIFLGLFFEILFKEVKFPLIEHFAISSVACVLLIITSHFTFSQIELRAMNHVSTAANTIHNNKLSSWARMIHSKVFK